MARNRALAEVLQDAKVESVEPNEAAVVEITLDPAELQVWPASQGLRPLGAA